MLILFDQTVYHITIASRYTEEGLDVLSDAIINRQDELGGTNYGNLTVEWTLPPVRFRRFGVPDLYCNWTRLTLFSSGIVTNMDLPDTDFRKKASGNAGAQIDFRLVLFSSLQSTFSMGYAMAMAEGARWSNEFMISLKIL